MITRRHDLFKKSTKESMMSISRRSNKNTSEFAANSKANTPSIIDILTFIKLNSLDSI
jgi:hypothetical protein